MILMAVLWIGAANPAAVWAVGPQIVSENETAAPDIASAADNGLHGLRNGATYRSGQTLRFYATGAGYSPSAAQERNPVNRSTRYRPVSWKVGGKSGTWLRYSEETAGKTENGVYMPGEYRYNGSFQLSVRVAGAVPYTLQALYQEEMYDGAAKAWKRTGNTDLKSVTFYIKNDKIKKNQSFFVKPSSIALTEYGKAKSIKASKAVGKVEYVSSNPKVAKVNANGKVTPLLHGTATITVKAKGNQSYNPAWRTVRVQVSRTKISKNRLALVQGERKRLTVPGIARKIRWSSSDASVASVNKKGKVKARRTGSAIITAKVGKAKYTCRLKVKKYRSVSHRSITLNKGERSRFRTSLTGKGTVWESQKPDIASVSETGLVTALNAGSCKIYATTRQARRYIFHVTIRPVNPAPGYNPAPVNPAPAQPSMVWLPATGVKYHKIPNCGFMDPDRATQVSYEEAVRRGYGPCQICYGRQ